MKTRIQLLLLMMTMAVVFGCTKRSEEAKPEPVVQPASQAQPAAEVTPPKSGSGVGVVQDISKSRKFITLDHNDIPDIMEAMAMEYPVQSPDLLKGISIDDSVAFTLTKTPESQYMVTEIHKK